MQLLTTPFLERFPGRILNVHPSLLPAFPARTPVEDALAHGVKVTGATVHFVDEGIDTGPIVLQEAVDGPRGRHARDARTRGSRPSSTGSCRRRSGSSWTESSARPWRRRDQTRPDLRSTTSPAWTSSPRAWSTSASRSSPVAARARYLEEMGIAVTQDRGAHAGSGAARRPRQDVAPADPRRRSWPGATSRMISRRSRSTRSSRSTSSASTSTRSARRSRAHGVREEDAVEVIDIGGPAMLRAAAKNFAHVVPVSRGPQYERVLEELRNGGELSLETRRELAAEAFSVTAAYEASIAAWFMDRDHVPRPADPGFRESTRPLLRREPSPARGLLRGDRRQAPPALAGRAAARPRALVQQPQRPERGAALPARVRASRLRDRQARESLRRRGRGLDRARLRARARRRSCFGLRRRRRLEPARLRGARRPDRRGSSSRCCSRPATRTVRFETLAQKPATRILVDRERRRDAAGERDFKRVLGGLLVQDRDWDIEDRAGWRSCAARRARRSGATSSSPGASASR